MIFYSIQGNAAMRIVVIWRIWDEEVAPAYFAAHLAVTIFFVNYDLTEKILQSILI